MIQVSVIKQPSISEPIDTLSRIPHEFSRDSYLSPLPNWRGQFVSSDGTETADRQTEPAEPEAESAT